MEYESVRTGPVDPPITVEPATPGGESPFAWTEPVLTKPERHRCTHRLHFSDLNGRGQVEVAVFKTAIVLSWSILIFGFFLGGGLLAVSDERIVLAGLLLACGTALQPFGTVALARTLRRPHRPRDWTIATAGVGYLVSLVALGMLIVFAEAYAAAATALPFAVVLWQLFRFRKTLYGRSTCQAHPGHAPEIRALLRHDPSPSTAISGEARFSVRTCPHRIKFGDMRGRYKTLAIVNTVLLFMYGFLLPVVLLLPVYAPASGWGALGNGGAALASVAVGLLNLIGLLELHARSRRYHRASTWVYVCSLLGFGLTGALGLWSVWVFGDPLMLLMPALAAYWGFSAWVALTRLPPQSACPTLSEPPSLVKKMLKTPSY